MTRRGQDTIYEMVTNEITDGLKKGIIPWHRPFLNDGRDKNYRGNAYHGINVLLLALARMKNSSLESPAWLTFNQIKEMGGRLIKGSKHQVVIFSKSKSYVVKENGVTQYEDDGVTPLVRYYSVLRYHRVYNLSQCVGIDPPKWIAEDLENAELKKPQSVIDEWEEKPKIEINGVAKAYYRTSTDTVHSPEIGGYKSSEDYYSVLFHELVHSTGHESRLNRFKDKEFDDKGYSKEELVAEIGAAFLNTMTGINNADLLENSQAYINGWVKALENHKRMVVMASSKAQRAVDMILNRETEYPSKLATDEAH